MASENALTFWAIQNQKSIDLNINLLSWPQSWNLPFYDVEVSISIDANSFTGRGSDATKDIAINKALTEACERAVSKQNGFHTTNGLAANITLDTAMSAAYSELIERDLFLCHHLTSKPFFSVDNSRLYGNKFQHLVEDLASRGLSIKSFYLGSVNNIHVNISVLTGLSYEIPFGIDIGLGAHPSYEISLSKSMIECLRNAANAFFNPNTIANISIQEFNRKSQHSLADHGKLAYNIAYYELLRGQYMNSNATLPKNWKIGGFSQTVLTPAGGQLADIPLYFARVASKSTQSLFVGQATKKNINIDRIRGFSESDFFELKNINYLPHPLK